MSFKSFAVLSISIFCIKLIIDSGILCQKFHACKTSLWDWLNFEFGFEFLICFHIDYSVLKFHVSGHLSEHMSGHLSGQVSGQMSIATLEDKRRNKCHDTCQKLLFDTIIIIIIIITIANDILLTFYHV